MKSRRALVALAAAASAVSLATAALIQPWEGRRLVAYQDIVGVWTICDGETKGVRKGMTATPEQCDRMLFERVENDFYRPLRQCIDRFDSKPLSWRAAITSTAYNVGVATICRSTAARLAREGRMRESCEALTRFNRAGGKEIRGLKNRREFGDAERIGELELCLAGLP